MSRYLFVFPPLVGHISPAIGVARELRHRGHDVAWVVHEAAVGHVLGGEADKIYPAGDGILEGAASLLVRHEQLRGAAVLRFLWEEFLIPLAMVMADPVRDAIGDFAPDAVFADQQAFAGAVVAAERRLPWATSASTTSELFDPVMGATRIAEWHRRQLDGLYRHLRLPQLAEAAFDPRYSPHLLVVYSARELVGPVQRDLSSAVFVGPVLRPADRPVPFPWEWLENHGRHVLVSLGSIVRGKGVPFLERVMVAAEGQPYGVVLVGDAEALPPPPGNVLVHPFVPQLELLKRVDAVVCHGAANTIAEALMCAVPLVCAPMQLDQPILTAQVTRAGAGRRLSFARARPGEIREAIAAVLHDRSYRAAAAGIGASLRAAGGARAAADHLEALAQSDPGDR